MHEPSERTPNNHLISPPRSMVEHGNVGKGRKTKALIAWVCYAPIRASLVVFLCSYCMTMVWYQLRYVLWTTSTGARHALQLLNVNSIVTIDAMQQKIITLVPRFQANWGSGTALQVCRPAALDRPTDSTCETLHALSSTVHSQSYIGLNLLSFDSTSRGTSTSEPSKQTIQLFFGTHCSKTGIKTCNFNLDSDNRIHSREATS